MRIRSDTVDFAAQGGLSRDWYAKAPAAYRKAIASSYPRDTNMCGWPQCRATACAAGITPEKPIVRNNVARKDRKRGAERAGASRVMMARIPSTVMDVR
ncbi:hypothetical protein QQP08_026084 [Theobroma cacao]|nr:hypothetical protein QQP08_026084 [Theobroma cacao]